MRWTRYQFVVVTSCVHEQVGLSQPNPGTLSTRDCVINLCFVISMIDLTMPVGWEYPSPCHLRSTPLLRVAFDLLFSVLLGRVWGEGDLINSWPRCVAETRRFDCFRFSILTRPHRTALQALDPTKPRRGHTTGSSSRRITLRKGTNTRRSRTISSRHRNATPVHLLRFDSQFLVVSPRKKI